MLFLLTFLLLQVTIFSFLFLYLCGSILENLNLSSKICTEQVIWMNSYRSHNWYSCTGVHCKVDFCAVCKFIKGRNIPNLFRIGKFLCTSLGNKWNQIKINQNVTLAYLNAVNRCIEYDWNRIARRIFWSRIVVWTLSSQSYMHPSGAALLLGTKSSDFYLQKISFRRRLSSVLFSIFTNF